MTDFVVILEDVFPIYRGTSGTASIDIAKKFKQENSENLAVNSFKFIVFPVILDVNSNFVNENGFICLCENGASEGKKS